MKTTIPMTKKELRQHALLSPGDLLPVCDRSGRVIMELTITAVSGTKDEQGRASIRYQATDGWRTLRFTEEQTYDLMFLYDRRLEPAYAR